MILLYAIDHAAHMFNLYARLSFKQQLVVYGVFAKSIFIRVEMPKISLELTEEIPDSSSGQVVSTIFEDNQLFFFREV